MPASYPTSVFTWTDRVDGSDDVLAADVNSLAAEIIAVETDGNSNKLNIAQTTKDVSNLSKSVTAIAGGGSGSVTGSVTAPVSSLANTAAGAFSQLQLSGRTYTNIITNGNFVNTTGWTATDSTTISAANNILSIASDGTTATPSAGQYKTFIAGHQYYGRAIARVTNAVATNIAIRFAGGYGDIIQPTPTENAWYLLSKVFTTVEGGSFENYCSSTYVDAETANGKVTECKYIFCTNLTATFGAGNEPDAATCDKLFANWFDGTKSTAPSEIAATGKNLFDKSKVKNGYEITVADGVEHANAANCISEYIKVLPSTSYVVAEGLGSAATYGHGYYDLNKTFISGVASNGDASAFTTPADCVYLRISSKIADLATQQLEQAAAATAYAPYQSVKSYTPILHSVPAIADTYDCVTGVHTVNTALDSDISSTQYDSLDKATYTNVDVIKTTAFTTAKAGTAAIDGMVRYYNSAGVELSEIAAASIDAVSSIGKFYYHTDKTIWIFVAPDTYADIAAARTGLGTTSCRYQLATPTVTYYPQKAIPCPANATISQDNVISDYGFYSSGLTISDSTYPIVTLAEVVKIDQSTGAETQIVLSTCTVAGGGLSFTSTAIADGDLVWYRFYRSPYYTIGQIDYTRKYGVWEAWTPTLTWTTGTPASVTTVARAVKNGSTCYFNFMVTSADGNGATQLSISLPATPKDNNSLIAFSAQQLVNTTWTNPLAYLDDDSGGITFRSFATATDGQTVTIIVSGQYEI